MKFAQIFKLRSLRLAQAFVTVLYAIHFAFICRFAVDVPYVDEWDELPSASGGLSEFWQQHNEHRIVFTKIQTYLLFLLNGWDIRLHILINFVIFGFMLVLLYKLFVSLWPKNQNKALLALSFAPLLSPLLSENHEWAFQSQFHFFIIFGLLALIFFLKERPKLALLFCFASMVSFSAGVIFCTVIVVSRGVLWSMDRHYKRAGWIFLWLAVFLDLSSIGYANEVKPWPRVFPGDLRFWEYFFSSVALGLGITGKQFFLSLLAATAVGSCLLLNFLKFRRGEIKPEIYSIDCAYVLSVLGALAAIAVGRAGLGGDTSKASRYAEIALLLTPWTVLSLSRLKNPRWSYAAVAILFFVHAPQFKFYRVYAKSNASRLEGLRCVGEYYKNPEAHSGLCPTIYPAVAKDRFDRARENSLHFYRALVGKE